MHVWTENEDANSQLHSLVLHQGEVLDFSALCLIPTPVSVQVDNYVSHYLGISAAKVIEIWSCIIPKLSQYIAFPFWTRTVSEALLNMS